MSPITRHTLYYSAMIKASRLRLMEVLCREITPRVWLPQQSSLLPGSFAMNASQRFTLVLLHHLDDILPYSGHVIDSM